MAKNTRKRSQQYLVAKGGSAEPLDALETVKKEVSSQASKQPAAVAGASKTAGESSQAARKTGDPKKESVNLAPITVDPDEVPHAPLPPSLAPASAPLTPASKLSAKALAGKPGSSKEKKKVTFSEESLMVEPSVTTPVVKLPSTLSERIAVIGESVLPQLSTEFDSTEEDFLLVTGEPMFLADNEVPLQDAPFGARAESPGFVERLKASLKSGSQSTLHASSSSSKGPSVVSVNTQSGQSDDLPPGSGSAPNSPTLGALPIIPREAKGKARAVDSEIGQTEESSKAKTKPLRSRPAASPPAEPNERHDLLMAKLESIVLQFERYARRVHDLEKAVRSLETSREEQQYDLKMTAVISLLTVITSALLADGLATSIASSVPGVPSLSSVRFSTSQVISRINSLDKRLSATLTEVATLQAKSKGRPVSQPVVETRFTSPSRPPPQSPPLMPDVLSQESAPKQSGVAPTSSVKRSARRRC